MPILVNRRPCMYLSEWYLEILVWKKTNLLVYAYLGIITFCECFQEEESKKEKIRSLVSYSSLFMLTKSWLGSQYITKVEIIYFSFIFCLITLMPRNPTILYFYKNESEYYVLEVGGCFILILNFKKNKIVNLKIKFQIPHIIMWMHIASELCNRLPMKIT